MSKHTPNCPDAHGLVCHFQHHRTNPEKPFVYQSPNFPGAWRVSVKHPEQGLKIRTYFDRDKAIGVASRVAAGDLEELDAA